MDKNSAQVAVFIDYDNIERSVSDMLGRETQVDWNRVLQVAAQMGRVVLRRAYADWAFSPDRQRELLAQGVELVHVNSRRGKNAADIRIVIDALELLYSEQSGFTHALLVSGDGDFTELVHRLRTQGKIVIGMGVNGTSAEYLVNACDKFIFYDKLAGVRPEPKAKKTPEPAPPAKPANGTPSPPPAAPVNEPDSTPAPTPDTPEALLEHYLQILGKQRIRMTPNEHRPTIIFKFHELTRANPGLSLTGLSEKAHAHFAEHAPHILPQSITEIVHQLFHTYCFEFEKDSSIEKLWDRKVTITSEITRANEMMERCDRGILQKLAQALGGPQNVNLEVAARVLYGEVRGEKMLQHIQSLLGVGA